MLISPSVFLKAIVLVLGIGAVVNGIYNLIYVRKFVPDAIFQYVIITRAMISIVVGLLAFFLPITVAANILSIMIYVLAGYLLVSSCLELFAYTKLDGDAASDRKQF